MPKLLRFMLVLSAALVVVIAYELYQVYLLKESRFIWRTQTWKETDVQLSELQKHSPDVTPVNFAFDAENEIYVKQPDAENGTAYANTQRLLKQMEEDIRISAPKITESELTFKKALYIKKKASVAFAISDPVERKKAIIEVYNELHYNIFRLPAMSANEDVNLRFVRRLLVHVLAYTFQGNGDASAFEESDFREGEYFKTIEKTYGVASPGARSALYIYSLFSEQDLKNDNQMVAQRMLLFAAYAGTDLYEKNPALKNKMFKEVAALADLFPTARQTTLNASAEENAVNPKALYARALGLLSEHPDSGITVAQAQNAFDDAEAEIAKQVRSPDDVLHRQHARLLVSYIEFLYKAHGNKVDAEVQKRIDALIALEKDLSSSSLFTKWYSEYIKGLSSSDSVKGPGKLLPSILKEYPGAKSFLDAHKQ